MGFAFLIAILFLICAGMIAVQCQTKKVKNPKRSKKSLKGSITTPPVASSFSSSTFYVTLLIFLILRLLIAAFTKGYPSDLACWAAWGQRVFQLGPQHFYAPDYFCDYPPGYLYILGFVAGIADFFQVSGQGLDFLVKLPALCCDIFLFVFLFQLGKKYWDQKTALSLGSLFLLTPIFCFDSAVWGQIESVLLLFLSISLYKLYKKQYLSAVLLYVLGVLIKPQGLILAPIYLVAVLESRSLKAIFSCILGGFLLFEVCTIPFSTAWQSYRGISAFFHALNPWWVVEKYTTTLASYPYFSVNAFNLYGLLNLNWVSLDTGHPILLSFLNGAILATAVLGTLFLYFKIKNQASRLFLSAYFLFGFLFTFAFKMHERYIVLPLFFLILDYIFSKNKKILYLFSGLSTVGFLNLYYVLQLVQGTNAAPDYRLVAPLSFLEVLLFLLSLWIIYRDYIQTPKSGEETKNTPFFSSIRNQINSSPKISSWLNTLSGYPHREKITKKMTRLDCYLLSIIILVYSLVAFVNLGDRTAPQTYYQPKVTDESFVITFSDTTTLSEINYYCGIGDVGTDPGILFQTSLDGATWTGLSQPCCTLDSVFSWKVQSIDPVQAKYLRGMPQSTEYTLFEVGFRDLEGNLIAIESITGKGESNFSAMIDEQACVTNLPSYKNSTYFDEIYHPRTAYEHLHGMPYYETTHPPLAKLMMAVGISLFGMTPFGWRSAGTLMGVLMLPIFYLFLKQLFGRTRYAVMGTLLFAFDFMHFSLTRMGTIDSYPVFFILCMYYFMYRFGILATRWAKGETVSRKRQLLYLVLSGVAMGLGCASKWTAVYAAAGLAIEFFIILYQVWKDLPQDKKGEFLPFCAKTCSFCLLFFIVIPAGIYTLSYLPISMVDGYGNVFEAMWNNQEYMLSYHGKLGGTHPYSSKWYTWPFVYKPMWAYQAPATSINADQIGCISIFQNPFLSWLGIAAFFYSLYLGWKQRDRRVLFILIALLAQYLPWIFVRRYALQYHFFATMPFLILFLIYAMENLEKRFRNFGYLSVGITCICLILFLTFYPVLSGTPVSRFYAETILRWFPSWVFFI